MGGGKKEGKKKGRTRPGERPPRPSVLDARIVQCSRSAPHIEETVPYSVRGKERRKEERGEKNENGAGIGIQLRLSPSGRAILHGLGVFWGGGERRKKERRKERGGIWHENDLSSLLRQSVQKMHDLTAYAANWITKPKKKGGKRKERMRGEKLMRPAVRKSDFALPTWNCSKNSGRYPHRFFYLKKKKAEGAWKKKKSGPVARWIRSGVVAFTLTNDKLESRNCRPEEKKEKKKKKEREREGGRAVAARPDLLAGITACRAKKKGKRRKGRERNETANSTVGN